MRREMSGLLQIAFMVIAIAAITAPAQPLERSGQEALGGVPMITAVLFNRPQIWVTSWVEMRILSAPAFI